ncbi:uncharacterized protein PV09_06915 [Verruconis gallopava]|uniref:DUF7924 domain-containing protein n=1 Tax=Verruconis gallopava TaxID=253628 RepID=A0A0D2ARA7_9PEZI|nr:uncharacterized protein PV09_06915 [Verruconis gallopava]KIW01739.1 hypothetical protein PV09_06915 [Verruconis gallopava]
MFSRARNLSELPLINSSDPSFELELHRRRAFYIDNASHLPDDLADFEAAVNASRASPEPDEAYLASFQRRLRNSCNEAAVVQGVMPKLVPIDSLLDNETLVTVPNQQWDKECGLRVPPSAQYRIPPPKPDQTIGLAASVFSAYETALAYLAHKARPIKCLPSLAFPLVTVEAKGDRGQNVCRSQSLHNAAVMLHQLLRLWEDTNAEGELFYKSLVCTISITTQTCAVSHFWMVPGANGTVSVYGRLFKSWTLNLQEAIGLSSIVTCIRNAIDFTIKRGTKLITERLEALEAMTIYTPPSSCCSPSCRKRRSSDRDSYKCFYSSSPEPEDTPLRKKVRITSSQSRRWGRRRSSGSST